MSSNTIDALARQWDMLQMIPRAPNKTSVQELKHALDERGHCTTARTIARDLQSLSARFELIADETNKPYGWSWAKDAKFAFTPRLTTSQGVALLLSHVHLKNFLPQVLLRELDSVFQLAEREVAATGWKDWHKRTAVLPTNMALLAPKLDANVLDHVHAALSLRRCLSGCYRSRGSESARELTIHPLGLVVRGAAQYLVCTLRDYKDVRQLALHRLSHTKVMDALIVPPSGFDFAKYIASSATKYWANGKIGLVARFTAEAAGHLRETPLSKDQVLRDLDDGRVELSAPVESDETLRWWLLGFGDQVEVVAPVELRVELRNVLKLALKHYGRE